MKSVILILMLWGCSFRPEIQVENTCLTFVSMEVSDRREFTVYIYHWVDESNNMAYVQYSKYLREYQKGECVPMLIRR